MADKIHPAHRPLPAGMLSRTYPCPYCRTDTPQKRVKHDTFQCMKCAGYVKA